MLGSFRSLNGTVAILAIVTSLLVGLFLGGGTSQITGWLRQLMPSPAITAQNEATPTIAPPTETATIEPTATEAATETAEATATEAATETAEATATEAATETAEATPTRKATRTPRATRTERPTETVEAEATETPSEEAEATETPSADVQEILENGGILLQTVANGNVNIRQAPNGTILGSLGTGTYAEVIGRTQDNSWVQIRLLDEEGEVWISTNPNFVEITGDYQSLPIISEEVNTEG